MSQPNKTLLQLPKAVKTSSRSSFSIHWYATEYDANLIGAIVRAQGISYNGGFYHGRNCGRDRSWDYMDDTHGMLYAVTN